MRNQVTLRDVGKLRLHFTPMFPDELILKILGPQAMKLQDSYREVQGIRLW
jgi:hypothetical protein